jgi:endonuclease/exonuclease/phosphatase family metal-dependent hydrolase
MKNFTAFLLLATLLTACNSNIETEIMSYNVHHCRGMDNIIDYNRTAEVINRISPDFVALQELDSATSRNNGNVCIEELAKLTGMKATYASAIKFGGGSYGIGLLSKEEPIDVKTIPLVSRGEARRLLVAEFENIVVGCTHLALNQEDRTASMEIICRTMQGYKKPILLAGDMNSHATDMEQVILNKKFTTLNNTQDATYPSIGANECIDYIYAAKDDNYVYKVKESRVFSEDSIVSDHLPLLVRVEIQSGCTK